MKEKKKKIKKEKGKKKGGIENGSNGILMVQRMISLNWKSYKLYFAVNAILFYLIRDRLHNVFITILDCPFLNYFLLVFIIDKLRVRWKTFSSNFLIFFKLFEGTL